VPSLGEIVDGSGSTGKRCFADSAVTVDKDIAAIGVERARNADEVMVAAHQARWVSDLLGGSEMSVQDFAELNVIEAFDGHEISQVTKFRKCSAGADSKRR
jgi:hypothetical protein